MSRPDSHPASTRWRRSTGNRFRQQFLDFLGIRASAHDNWGLFIGFGLSRVRSFPALRLSFLFDFAFWPREFRSNGCGDVCGIDLVPPCRACEVGVLLKRLPRVVAGAIQVGNKSAHSEETVKVGGLHRCHGSRRNLLVVNGLSAP
jgi:hypothetical protein